MDAVVPDGTASDATVGDGEAGDGDDLALDSSVCTRCLDGALADRGPVDAADLGAADDGVFPFEPDPLCEPPGPEVRHDLGERVIWEGAPSGIHVHAEDIDRDGRCEILAMTAAGAPPDAPVIWDRTVSIFEWSPMGGAVHEGDVQGLYPLATIDLPGVGIALVGSSKFFLDPDRMMATSITLAVRRDRPDDPRRFDEELAIFVDDTGGGRLEAMFFNPEDVDVVDGDGDGQPELLTDTGALLEWRGNGFMPVWDVAEADPRDDAQEIGGSAAGQVSAGDLDGDGRMELVLTGYAGLAPVGAVEGYPRHARIFEQRADDTYALLARLPYGADGPQFGAVGDLDGDGRAEVLFGGDGANCARFEVWRAAGDDHYERMWRLDRFLPGVLATERGASAFGDLDGDGDDELVINLGDIVTAWDWDGESMRQVLGYAIAEDVPHWPVRVCDLDGDGVEEIIFSERTRAAQGYLEPGGVRILSWVP